MAMVLLISSFSTYTYADSTKKFSDVASNHWGKSYIDYLSSTGIITGYPDGSFKPSEAVKVNEFIAMTVKALGYSLESKSSDWAKPFIDKAIELKIIENREFNSYSANINREQMVSIAANALALKETKVGNQIDLYLRNDLKDYHLIDNYYKQNVFEVYKWGLVNGFPDGTFKPKNTASRAEACVVLNKMMKPETRSPYTKSDAPHVMMPIGVWYDADGNIVPSDKADNRFHTYKEEKAPMYAPIYNGKPVAEIVEVAKILTQVRNNGKGYLALGYDQFTQNFDAAAYQSKSFYDGIFDAPTLLEQSFLMAERMDFIFKVETLNLGNKYKPYYINLWKRSHSYSYSSYSVFFAEKYGDQIKPIFQLLFENEFDQAWSLLNKALDYKGQWTKVETTINGRVLYIGYDSSGLSLSISLKNKEDL